MSTTNPTVGMKRTMALPEDESPVGVAPTAGVSRGLADALSEQAAALEAAMTPPTMDPSMKVKARVKELEVMLEKAKVELQEAEAEKFKIATPEGHGSRAPSKGDMDEIGA